jgi:hypothetical protein
MARPPTAAPLFRALPLNYRTQYAEVRERARAAGPLLPGTPGTLTLRSGTGYGYWYRRYKAIAQREVEDIVCKDGDEQSLAELRTRIEAALWTQEQLKSLRLLGFQVASKEVARVLVELHNQGLFEGGLVVVGTLAFMAWLNEYGAAAAGATTDDIDLARRQKLKVAAPLSLLETLEAMRLDFVPVPGMPSSAPSTSLKRPGAAGLRLDLLVPGARLGQAVPIPELQWHAASMPHFDYLLADTREAAILAGGQCIPVRLPAPERFVLHKLYSSVARVNNPTKAAKDVLQAATLAATLVETDDADLTRSARKAPAAMRARARRALPSLRRVLRAHASTLAQLESVLG